MFGQVTDLPVSRPCRFPESSYSAVRRGIIGRLDAPMMPTLPPVDFPAAARRHMKDAILLESSGRFPNAGYLYGYVAECGLKAILVWHKHPIDSDGSPTNGKFRVHVDKLVISKTMTAMTTFLTGRSGTKYLALMPNITDFSDWNVAHRYYSEAALPGSFDKWKQAAAEVGRMLDHALTSGLK